MRSSTFATENRGAAGRLADRVFSLLEQLDRGDFEGAEVRLTSGEVLRSWAIPPYRVYYLREPDGILVVRVYHQARRPIAK
jgi:plasmid stabilization system protein ParE